MHCMFDDIILIHYLSFKSIERYIKYIQYEMIQKGNGHHLNPINPCAFTCTRFNLHLK